LRRQEVKRGLELRRFCFLLLFLLSPHPSNSLPSDSLVQENF